MRGGASGPAYLRVPAGGALRAGTRDTRAVDAFGYVVIAVLVLAVVLGILAARSPVRWDELGGAAPMEAPPTPPVDDAAELRALIEAKRAARAARGGRETAGDRARAADAARSAGGAPWAHLDAEVVDEARGLVARRRARLERQGRPVPDELSELVRLLGPPNA